MYKCMNRLNRPEKLWDIIELIVHKDRWELLLAGMFIAERSVTWDGYSRVANLIHTHELDIVSMGKLIDTVVDVSFMHAGETVNCCQYVQDLKAIGKSWYHNISLSLKNECL